MRKHSVLAYSDSDRFEGFVLCSKNLKCFDSFTRNLDRREKSIYFYTYFIGFDVKHRYWHQ